MDLAEFTQALNRLRASDVHRVAAALHDNTMSAADELDAWRATLTIDRALRRSQRIRLAARAASAATHTVLAAAEADGVKLPDAEVTHVARAAAEVARGLVAGIDAAAEVRLLLRSWTPLGAPA